VAVAALLPTALPVAENANDCEAFTAIDPIVHVAVPLERAQPDGSVAPRVTPVAGAKVSVAELLATGPALLTWTVYVKPLPTVTEETDEEAVTRRSTTSPDMADACAELFAGVVSLSCAETV